MMNYQKKLLGVLRSFRKGLVLVATSLSLLASTLAIAESVSVVTYYHNNLQGSPFATSVGGDPDPEIVWTQSYTPYGYRPETATEATHKSMALG